MAPKKLLSRVVRARPLLRCLPIATALAVCALVSCIASSGSAHPAKPLNMARAMAATGTSECGEVGGGTWSAAGSPYLICSSGVTVASGSALTIDATLGSVTVVAQGSGGITSSGTLSTTGTTPVNVVTLTSVTASPGAWNGISTSGQNASITLSNTSISYATSALTNTCPTCPMSLTAVSIQQTSSVAILSNGSLSMSGGSISNTGELAATDFAPAASGILAGGPTTVQGTSITTAPSSAIVLADRALGSQASATVTGVSINGVGEHDGAAISVVVDSYHAVFSPLTIQNNTITNSGFGAPGYPAISIYWTSVDLANAISGNTGSGNYLDAVWCDLCSASTSFTWVTPTNGSAQHPLGYLLTNGLNLQGNTLSVPANGIVKLSGGGLYQGRVVATAGGAVFTSIADNTAGMRACPSVLVGSCAARPGDWGGIDVYTLPHGSSPLVALTNATIEYAAIGVDVEFDGQTLPAKPAGADATLSGVTIAHGFAGVAGVDASISYSGGAVADMVDNPNPVVGSASPPLAFTALGGYGISVSGDATINGVSVQRTDGDGIDVGPYWSPTRQGGAETVTNNAIDHADLNKQPTDRGAITVSGDATQSDPETVKNNTVTNSGSSASPVFAIVLHQVNGDLGTMVSGNLGDGNYSDTIWFDDSIDTASLTWISPQNSSASHPLGFAGRLTMQGAGTLTIPSGAVVKTNLVLDGARLDATAGGATFDIPSDDSIGPPTCFAFSNPCAGYGAGNDIIDATADTNGHRGNIAISNATMLDAKQPQCSAAINATSGATSTAGSLTDGVVLSNVTVHTCGTGGVYTSQTPTSITGGSFTGGGVLAHGPVSVSGTSFTGGNSGVFDSPDSNGAPVGPLTVTHCTFSQAATGVEAVSVTSLSITGSSFTGGGIPIGIVSSTVDLATDLSGNTAASNTADEVELMQDTDTGSFTWPAAVNSSTPHTPYFAVQQGLTVDDATMTMAANSVYSDWHGTLLFQGGKLDAQAGGVVFTGPACVAGCGFGGIQLRASTSSINPAATATLNGATITHASTPLQTFDTASASVTCSTLYANRIGVASGGAGITLSQSTLPGESGGPDVSATVPTSATNDWWGQASGPRQSQTSGPVTTSPFLTSAPACAPPIKPGGRALASTSSAQQYTMSGSDGQTWTAVDPANLTVSFTPSADGTAVIVANADLWTDTAGYNQDIGIEVSTGGFSNVLAWHESGGFGGTFSPNAAAVQSQLYVRANTTYTATLVWKANKPMPSSARIHIGAGPLGGAFSPTTLDVLTYPAGTVQVAESTNQYQLTSNDGNTWTDVDSKLRLIITPPVASTTLLSANADLWTAAAGINQDVAITVSPPCAGGASSSPAWHESGGYAGSYSPNAAFVQETCAMSANTTYTVTLQWKSNKPMQASSGIYIGAGPSSGSFFSPTSLYAVLEPGASAWTGSASGSQYSLSGSDGQTWQDVDGHLQETITAPQNCTARITANADLWTATGGVNQDLGIAVAQAGQPESVVAWHESGGFAGTYSPNAAFVQASVPLSSGVGYTFSLEWKSNKSMSPNDLIYMGAGSSGTSYSPATLIVDLDC